ncbi:MAG: hypothetical protein WAW88_04035 [Nocardioides sp.]
MAAALVCAPAAAAGAEDPIVVTVAPESVEMPLSGTATVVVVATNHSPTAVDVSLKVIGDVTVAQPLLSRNLAAGSSASWSVALGRASSAALSGSVVLLVDAETESGTFLAAKTVMLTGVGDFDISKATLTSGSTTLRVDDVHESQFLVRLTNPSAEPVTVQGIDGFGPDYVKVSPGDAGGFPCVVAAHSSKTFPMIVAGQGYLQRGTAEVDVVARLGWGGPLRQAGTLAVSQAIDVGAFAESGIGEILAVPTLLFVPGAALLAFLAFAWKVGVTPHEGVKESPVPMSGPQSGVAAILLSSIAVALWWVLTDPHRSLLAGYGTGDIAWLTVRTCVVGLGAYLLACAVLSWRRKRVRRRLSEAAAKMALAHGMEPLAVLERMAQRGAELWTTQAIQHWEGGWRRVLLPNDGLPDQEVLVCPPIEVMLAEEVGRPSEQDQQAEMKIIEALSRRAPAHKLNEVMGTVGHLAKLRWRPGSGLSGLQLARMEDLTVLPDPAPLVLLA